MADNKELNAGSGGATVGTDEIAGVDYQRIKIILGADGTNDGDVASGNPMPVDLGANNDVTLATLPDTASGDLAAIAALLGTIDTDTGNIVTSVQLLDNYVYVDDADWAATSSSHALVGGVYQSSPGTITDGDTGPVRLNSNGAMHISIQEGAPASPTEYSEDDAADATATGYAMLAERDDALGGITPVEGDWSKLYVDANGALWTRVSGTVTASVSGTLTVTDAAEYVDDADWTALTSSHDLIGGVYQSTPGAITDGDTGPLRLTENGAAHVSIQGTPTVTANLSATDNAVLDAIAASVAGTLTVGSHAVTNAGTFAVQESGAALTALQLIDDVVYVDDTATHSTGTSKLVGIGGVAVPTDTAISANDIGMVGMSLDRRMYTEGVGNIAHDGADSGNPIKVGAKAYANDGTAPQTAVAEGDRVNLIANLEGIQYVKTSHPFYWRLSSDYASAQTNASLKTAPGAGLKLYVTDVIISNGATAGNITLLDGSGGTVLLEIYAPITGGVSHSFATPIALTANTALVITSTTVTTHSVTITGFTAA